MTTGTEATQTVPRETPTLMPPSPEGEASTLAESASEILSENSHFMVLA